MIVAESPGETVEGFAEQLTVGGSYALIVNGAEQSAISPGLLPSEIWPFAVYVPGFAVLVSMFAVLEVPEIVPPSAVHVYEAVFFGFRFAAVPVTVSGSPGKAVEGDTAQE